MSDPARKMSLVQATMLVAGNMIGTGVFLLPSSLASVGGIAVFGWIVATTGAVALGLVFAKLGELDPQEGGPDVGFRVPVRPVVLADTAELIEHHERVGCHGGALLSRCGPRVATGA